MNGERNFLQLTADIVSAFVANNHVASAQLADLIASVHKSLTRLKAGTAAPVVADKPVPVVPVKKSVAADAITCLFDGKKFKSLKRHLAAHHGMNADEYRAHFDLPGTYPMVSSEYAARRSKLAKTSGLGQRRDRLAKPTSGPLGRPKKAAPTAAK